MKQLSLSAILLFLFAGKGLFAQSGSGQQNTLLPEINPQDIEIRSEFTARFPGLRRQPILGFNPTPRVFRIDPDRLPFMETPEEAVAGISTTQLDRPVPPAQHILRAPARTGVLIRAGAGSFISPELEAYTLYSVNRDNFLSAGLNFNSSDGHLNSQNTSYRFLDVNALYSAKLSNKIRASFRGEAFSDFNHTTALPESVFGNDSGAAVKDYVGGSFGVILNGKQNALEGWKYFLNLSAAEIGLESPVEVLNSDLKEQSLKTGFEKKWAGGKLNEVLGFGINLSAGNYSPSGIENQQWLNTSAAFTYQTLLNYDTEITLNAGAGYVTDGLNKVIVFTSDSKIKYALTDRAALHGSLFARPEVKTALEHHQINRLMAADTQLQYEYTIGAEGGIEFVPFKPTKLFGTVGYRNIANNAYYVRNEEGVPPAYASAMLPPTFEAFYDVQYADATVFEIRAGITQQIMTDILWFDGLIYARRPKLKDAGDIPFEERLGANAAFNMKPSKRIKIQSWAHYIGEREDASSPENLNGYILLNAGADIDITDKFGVYVKVLNILSSSYEIWNGYTERPFQLYGGIKLKL